MRKYKSYIIKIVSLAVLVAFIATQCGISYALDQSAASNIRVQQAKDSTETNPSLAAALGRPTEEQPSPGSSPEPSPEATNLGFTLEQLRLARNEIFKEIDDASYSGRGSYNQFVRSTAKRFNIPVEKITRFGLAELCKRLFPSSLIINLSAILLICWPSMFPVFNSDGSLKKLEYLTRFVTFPMLWWISAAAYFIYLRAYDFGGSNSAPYFFIPFTSYFVIGSVVRFVIAAVDETENDGHELTHVYQYVTIERLRQVLHIKSDLKKIALLLNRDPILEDPLNGVSNNPPTKDQLKIVVSAIEEELEKYAADYTAAAAAAGASGKQRKAISTILTGAAAASTIIGLAVTKPQVFKRQTPDLPQQGKEEQETSEKVVPCRIEKLGNVDSQIKSEISATSEKLTFFGIALNGIDENFSLPPAISFRVIFKTDDIDDLLKNPEAALNFAVLSDNGNVQKITIAGREISLLANAPFYVNSKMFVAGPKEAEVLINIVVMPVDPRKESEVVIGTTVLRSSAAAKATGAASGRGAFSRRLSLWPAIAATTISLLAPTVLSTSDKAPVLSHHAAPVAKVVVPPVAPGPASYKKQIALPDSTRNRYITIYKLQGRTLVIKNPNVESKIYTPYCHFENPPNRLGVYLGEIPLPEGQLTAKFTLNDSDVNGVMVSIVNRSAEPRTLLLDIGKAVHDAFHAPILAEMDQQRVENFRLSGNSIFRPVLVEVESGKFVKREIDLSQPVVIQPGKGIYFLMQRPADNDIENLCMFRIFTTHVGSGEGVKLRVEGVLTRESGSYVYVRRSPRINKSPDPEDNPHNDRPTECPRVIEAGFMEPIKVTNMGENARLQILKITDDMKNGYPFKSDGDPFFAENQQIRYKVPLVNETNNPIKVMLMILPAGGAATVCRGGSCPRIIDLNVEHELAEVVIWPGETKILSGDIRLLDPTGAPNLLLLKTVSANAAGAGDSNLTHESNDNYASLLHKIRARVKARNDNGPVSGEKALMEARWLLDQLLKIHRALSRESSDLYDLNMAPHLTEMSDMVMRLCRRLNRTPSAELLIAAMLHDASRLMSGFDFRADEVPPRGDPGHDKIKDIEHPARAARFIRPLLKALRIDQNIAVKVYLMIENHETGKIMRPAEEIEAFKFTKEEMLMLTDDLAILNSADALSLFTPVILTNLYNSRMPRQDRYMRTVRERYERAGKDGREVADQLMSDRQEEFSRLPGGLQALDGFNRMKADFDKAAAAGSGEVKANGDTESYQSEDTKPIAGLLAIAEKHLKDVSGYQSGVLILQNGKTYIRKYNGMRVDSIELNPEEASELGPILKVMVSAEVERLFVSADTFLRPSLRSNLCKVIVGLAGSNPIGKQSFMPSWLDSDWTVDDLIKNSFYKLDFGELMLTAHKWPENAPKTVYIDVADGFSQILFHSPLGIEEARSRATTPEDYASAVENLTSRIQSLGSGYNIIQIIDANTAALFDASELAESIAMRLGFDEAIFNLHMPDHSPDFYDGIEVLGDTVRELVSNIQHLNVYSKEAMLMGAREITENNRKGIELVFVDNGPGIINIREACETFYTSSGKAARGRGLILVSTLARNNYPSSLTVESKGKKVFYRGEDEPEVTEIDDKTAGTLIRVKLFLPAQSFDVAAATGVAKAAASGRTIERLIREYTELEGWLFTFRSALAENVSSEDRRAFDELCMAARVDSESWDARYGEFTSNLRAAYQAILDYFKSDKDRLNTIVDQDVLAIYRDEYGKDFGERALDIASRGLDSLAPAAGRATGAGEAKASGELKKLLDNAREGKYCVPAFVTTFKGIAPEIFIRAAIKAAMKKNSPVIILAYPISLYGLKMKPVEFKAVVEKIKAELKPKVSVFIGLDHGSPQETGKLNDAEQITEAINAGFDIVTVDARANELPGVTVKQAVDEVINVVKLAKEKGVLVEGVFGETGRPSNPKRAAAFAKRTGIDCMAISFGAIHGGRVDKSTGLSMSVATEIANLTETPLVGHGGSSLSDEALAELRQQGVSKINIGTCLLNIALASYEAYPDNHQKAEDAIMGLASEKVEPLVARAAGEAKANGDEDLIRQWAQVISNYYLQDENQFVERLTPLIGKEEAGALKDMIATRSYVPEGVSPHHPSDNVSHYYLDDGYFFRGQLSDLDECITTGAIVRVGQGKDVNRTYVSREFRDVFGMFRDKWSVEDQGIFIYPSAYFNRSVNDGSAEAGFCTIERDGWVTTYALQTWPHFKIDLPVGQAKYLIVHRRKYEEYMDILKDKKPDPKGLKPQLQKLMKNGLKIVPVGKSEDESAYVNYKDIVHEIFTAVKRRRVGRLYLFLADEGREMGGYGNKADVWLPKAVFWVLQSPEMAAIREKITSDKGLIDAVAKANGDEVAAITMLDKAREEQLKKVVIVIDDNGLVAELTKKGIEAVRADNEAHAQQLKKEYASSFVIIIHPSNQTIQLEGLPPVAIEGEVAESLQKLLDYNV